MWPITSYPHHNLILFNECLSLIFCIHPLNSDSTCFKPRHLSAVAVEELVYAPLNVMSYKLLLRSPHTLGEREHCFPQESKPFFHFVRVFQEGSYAQGDGD